MSKQVEVLLRLVTDVVQVFKCKHNLALSVFSIPLANVPFLQPPRLRSGLNLFEGIAIYTRARFEELCQDLFHITLEPIKKVYGDSKIDK